MNDDFKNEDSSGQPQEEQDVVALVKSLQQKIISLEKKVDILLNRSSQRINESKSFSRPFRPRPFGRPERPGMARQGERSRDRNFSAGRFDKKRGGEGKGLDGYSERSGMARHGERSREGNFSAGRFDRKRDGEGKRSEQREKPFYHFDKRQGRAESRKPGQKDKSFFRHKRDRPSK